MDRHEVGSGKKLNEDNPLYKEINWITKKIDYKMLTSSEIEDENHHILVTLKLIENRISKELDHKKVTDLTLNKTPPENAKVLEEKIKNNDKYIEVLKRDYNFVETRKSNLNEGLESRAIDLKFAMEKKL